MTITVYKSTDASAPAVGRAAGDLITLLDACLVNGYSGKAAAGWTKEYSGTNKAVYKNGTGSSGKYLRIQDDIVDYCGGTGKIDLADGASGVDTLTGKSIGAVSASMYIHKPDTVANRGKWTVIADAKAAIILTSRTPSTASDGERASYTAAFIGDIISYNSTTDNYRFTVGGDASTTPSSSAFIYNVSTTSLGGTPAYMHGYPEGRVDNGIVSYLTSYHPGLDAMQYPSVISKGHILFPMLVVHSSGIKNGPELRGRLPGVYASPYSAASDLYLKNHDTVTFSSGDLNGKSFEIYRVLGAGAAGRAYYFETSDTWGN